MKKRKGNALIWVVLIFTVLMILMASVSTLVAQDLIETKRQEERLQTYYVALSGIDLTYAALFDTAKPPAMKNGIQRVIEKLKSNPTQKLSENISVVIGGRTIGIATVTIDRVAIDSANWIRVTSVGVLTGKNTSVTSVMRINESNTNQIIRER